MLCSFAILLASSERAKALFGSRHNKLSKVPHTSAPTRSDGESLISRATAKDSSLLAMARSGFPNCHKVSEANDRQLIFQFPKVTSRLDWLLRTDSLSA